VVHLKKAEVYQICQCKCANKTCKMYKSKRVKLLATDFYNIKNML
jgi:hypothetical protein